MRSDLLNGLRGFAMGAADIVPGVSGGTVALILGHYQRLVVAISRFDARALGLLRSRRLLELAHHIDLRFLVALGVGIATGIVLLAGLMNWLLDQHKPQTLAVFMGLVLASVWVVRREVDRWTPARWLLFVLGTLIALAIVSLPATTGSMGLAYLFICASIAICAMILPGISGAFILLVLGVYHPITGLVRDAARLQIGLEGLAQVGVFIAGCAFGLLAFSRLLRWLLEHQRGNTMALLIGLMTGSLVRLWPLQMPTPETAGLAYKMREFVLVSPQQWPGALWTIVVLVLVAAALVLSLDRLARRSSGHASR